MGWFLLGWQSPPPPQTGYLPTERALLFGVLIWPAGSQMGSLGDRASERKEHWLYKVLPLLPAEQLFLTTENKTLLVNI